MDESDTPDEESHDRHLGPTIGAGIAIGVGVGTALWASTGSPVWILFGLLFGLAIGTGMHTRKVSRTGADDRTPLHAVNVPGLGCISGAT